MRLLITGATAAALVSLLAGPASRLRGARRYHPVLRTPSAVWVMTQLAAGTAVALLVILFYRRLGVVIDPASVDLRHFSLHPWRLSRIVLLMAIVAMQLAVLWGATLALLAAGTHWRVPRGATRLRGAAAGVVADPGGGRRLHRRRAALAPPGLGLLLSTGACALAALVGSRISSAYRRATVAARILALFLAFLIPTLLLYPAMNFFAERATRELIAREYAVQAQNHVQTLLRYTEEARREVDAIETLPDLVSVEAPEDPPPSDAAFLVWRQTALGRQRLTSAVELYNRSGKLVSRFPLNIPEYTAAAVAEQRRLRVGRVRRSRAIRLRGAAHAARRAARLHGRRLRRAVAAGRRHPARALRIRNAALHHVAESLLRGRPGDGRPRRGRHRRWQRRGRDLRLGPPADLHLGALGLADHRCAVRPALRLARAVLGGGLPPPA